MSEHDVAALDADLALAAEMVRTSPSVDRSRLPQFPTTRDCSGSGWLFPRPH